MSPHTTDTLFVNDSITLETIGSHHAPALFALVEKNRAALGEWLPWLPHMTSVENFLAYIENCKEQHEAGTDYGFMILWKNQPVGRIGLHYINHQNKNGAIGYWIDTEFSGEGIVTKACKAVVRFGFEQLGLRRIEIKCATGNIKSAAIAERLGFLKEGVLREAEQVNGVFHDLYVYSLLQKEYKPL